MKYMRTYLNTVILSATLACAAHTGYAQTLDMMTRSLNVGAEMETGSLRPNLSSDQIIQRLKIQGYTNITIPGTGQSGTLLHVFADTSSGEAVDLAIEPKTGGIISMEPRVVQ